MYQFSYSYKKGDFELELNSEFEEQGITVLFGESGCGKSTLLRLLSGLEGKGAGTLKVSGEIIQDDNSSLEVWERGFAYVSQEMTLFPHLTVNENLMFAQKRKQRGKNSFNRDNLIQHFDIGDLLLRYPSNLSGGQQQRVLIVRALLSEPRCLLLDEPVSALDEEFRFRLIEILRAIVRENKLCILYVTHDRREVAQIADSIMVMKKGEIISRGRYEEIATNINLSFAHGREAISILPVIVGERAKDHLTQLRYQEETLWIRTNRLESGATHRLQISANEVSITLNKNEQSSILNQLKVTISEIGVENNGQQLISLKVGDDKLLSRITTRSLKQLGLQIGTVCYANFKAVAVNL